MRLSILFRMLVNELPARCDLDYSGYPRHRVCQDTTGLGDIFSFLYSSMHQAESQGNIRFLVGPLTFYFLGLCPLS